jgi:hypothetical protein
MDHAEARELLGSAAVEPDGIARLEAGDTPEAAAFAGHLAGCTSCSTELARLSTAADVVRSTMRTLPERAVPPAGLRERTLAYVHEYGRPRGAATVGALAAVGVPDGGTAPVVGVSGTGQVPPAPAERTARVRPGILRPALLIGLAASLVVGIGLGGLAVGTQRQGQLDRQTATIAALTKVNEWTMRVASAPGATSVALTSPTGGAESGSVLYSPVTTELIAVMDGVVPPPPGREYRCWVRTPAANDVLGKMYFGGDVGYWGGRSPAVAGLPGGSVFGVSLVDVATGQAVGDPVLTGTL